MNYVELIIVALLRFVQGIVIELAYLHLLVHKQFLDDLPVTFV